MAEVFLARDLRHQRKVALKVLRPELAATMGPERFLREIRVTANLQHPHILPLFDSGEADGFLFYVMPYLEGESLRERLEREGELPVGEAARILREVVDALAGAHALGVVHRDVKPDNVMLSGRHAVVTDFGVARAVSEAGGRDGLTTEGVALGTPAYMAPEQAAADEHIDHRADIYAAGVLGYELLAGRPPFSGMTARQVLAAQVTEAPRPLTELRATVPPGLADVILRCLEKKPADRWQSAEELLRQLELFSTPATGTTPAQSPLRSGGFRVGSAREWVKGLAVVGVVATLSGAWLLTRGGPGPRAPDASDGPAPAVDALRDSGFVALPFTNRTGVDSLDAFGAILADYLTSQVSRNRIGWIVSGGTVRELESRRSEGEEAVGYISRATGARYVVTGSYYRQGGTLLVQGEVTDGLTSELVASVGPVEGPADDYMEAVRVAGEQMLVALARLLDPLSPAPSVAGTPPSFSAYRDYVEALDLWTDGERDRALELLYRALAEDSTYVAALVLASATEWNLGDIPTGDSLIQVAQRYRSEMAPWDLAHVDWLQAWFDGDREAVYRAGRRLAELDPSGPWDCRGARMANRLRQAVEDCMKGYEHTFDRRGLLNFLWSDLLQSLHLLGEHEDELEHARTARRHNPGRQLAFTFEARALAALGRGEELRALLDEAKTHTESGFSAGAVLREAGLELRAHGAREAGDELLGESLEWYRDRGLRNTGTASSLFATGMYEAARDLCREKLRESPDDVVYLGLLGSSAAALGDREAALSAAQRLAVLEQEPYTFGEAASLRALIVAQLGDRDEAVRLLHRAYEEGQSYGVWLHNAPQLDGLRGYPSFERFLAPKD